MLVKHPEYGYMTLKSVPGEKEIKSFYATLDREESREKALDETDYWEVIYWLRLKMIEDANSGKGRLLDVGAGNGLFLKYADVNGWDVEGIEPTHSMAKYIKDECGIKVFTGFLEEYSCDEGLFDVVHSTLVLEHVLDPEGFIVKALSLLRTGGFLWLEVPNDFNVLQHAIVDCLNKEQWWIVPEHHINYFTFDSLASLLENNGAKVVERLSTFPLEFFPLMGVDYIGDAESGKQAHGMRMEFEKNLIAHNPEFLLNLYRSFANNNIGRTCIIMAQKT